MKKRNDDFNERRVHLANLSDEELKNRFWSLASEIVEPMIELGRKNTTPSIERSVLLRMGFSSLEAKEIVNGVLENGLIGKGAGHVVYKFSKEKNISVREAGLMLIENKYWDEAVSLFAKEGAQC
ncbi:ornithine aminomutase subunit alpha [Romboutsia sp. 1001216sp1]|uniref:ornithine aminomutase subunit alpha n=1 Tax=Romboutsia TaxID=1501226 RepID=UPI000A93A93A|nr:MULTISPECIES: ornithine aminomutase subunit alpha [Romboutsia]MDB8790902.1 ornithine aminomutase subunit alpha [Romboutsia sp. 1001216sp1]MDB8792436.1 ornithine aminomutase subunit alpha [Romboutsia sp. 1001216sp1]MDB8795731.1 ornithine aminomutase subunit alpha [Romboutsia sp. 1001216sp1]MDB8798390.1 ornithine aminomutase subunit alpha [Romboutsia sp. 1001216sp1]MDB8800896.1 ornithine aminomutase subunit alpha [Romboutsia sp. 1001216sp1]